MKRLWVGYLAVFSLVASMLVPTIVRAQEAQPKVDGFFIVTGGERENGQSVDYLVPLGVQIEPAYLSFPDPSSQAVRQLWSDLGCILRKTCLPGFLKGSPKQRMSKWVETFKVQCRDEPYRGCRRRIRVGEGDTLKCCRLRWRAREQVVPVYLGSAQVACQTGLVPKTSDLCPQEETPTATVAVASVVGSGLEEFDAGTQEDGGEPNEDEGVSGFQASSEPSSDLTKTPQRGLSWQDIIFLGGGFVALFIILKIVASIPRTPVESAAAAVVATVRRTSSIARARLGSHVGKNPVRVSEAPESGAVAEDPMTHNFSVDGSTALGVMAITTPVENVSPAVTEPVTESQPLEKVMMPPPAAQPSDGDDIGLHRALDELMAVKAERENLIAHKERVQEECTRLSQELEAERVARTESVTKFEAEQRAFKTYRAEVHKLGQTVSDVCEVLGAVELANQPLHDPASIEKVLRLAMSKADDEESAPIVELRRQLRRSRDVIQTTLDASTADLRASASALFIQYREVLKSADRALEKVLLSLTDETMRERFPEEDIDTLAVAKLAELVVAKVWRSRERFGLLQFVTRPPLLAGGGELPGWAEGMRRVQEALDRTLEMVGIRPHEVQFGSAFDPSCQERFGSVPYRGVRSLESAARKLYQEGRLSHGQILALTGLGFEGSEYVASRRSRVVCCDEASLVDFLR